jgi:hypothetical protein
MPKNFFTKRIPARSAHHSDCDHKQGLHSRIYARGATFAGIVEGYSGEVGTLE